MRRPLALLFLVAFRLPVLAQPQEGLLSKFSFNGPSKPQEPGIVLEGAIPATDRFGNKRHAIFLQGNEDSYIDLGTGDLVKPVVGSLSMWLRIDQPIFKGKGVEQNPVITAFSHAGEDFNEAFHVSYHFNLGKLNVNASLDETRQCYIYARETAQLRRWYHVVVSWNDEYLRFYIDGELQGKVRKNFRTVFDGSPVRIGVRTGGKNSRFFQGLVDDIYFYDRVLQDEEVVQLFRAPDPNRLAVVFFALQIAVATGLVTLAIVVLVRRKIRREVLKEREKLAAIQKATEQEVKVLRTKMNPHFLFNALNSIHQFILMNENEKAEYYLSRFSSLLRQILDTSSGDTIVLDDELHMLRLYVELESMRFGGGLEFELDVDPELETYRSFIPNFIIQPFVENAIWHGLRNKKGEKKLSLSLKAVGPVLQVRVKDNGVGREQASKSKGLKKSYATEFVRQRLELLGQIHGAHFELEIIDNFDDAGSPSGTEVRLTVPLLNGVDAKSGDHR